MGSVLKGEESKSGWVCRVEMPMIVLARSMMVELSWKAASRVRR